MCVASAVFSSLFLSLFAVFVGSFFRPYFEGLPLILFNFVFLIVLKISSFFFSLSLFSKICFSPLENPPSVFFFNSPYSRSLNFCFLFSSFLKIFLSLFYPFFLCKSFSPFLYPSFLPVSPTVKCGEFSAHINNSCLNNE